MKYLSVCSGIEAASVAWKPMSWEPVAFAEIEPFPCAVLKHHYSEVPNWGDIENFKEWPDADVDVLIGGTPCQSFSVAGLRKGLDDPRGNLALIFLGIADKYRPRWILWENVPGVLSSAGGRDFGSFLGAMGKLGYGFAYRVLDAQYFGVPQRRRRVFVVGCLGNWQRAAAVLFERESMSGNSAPSRGARETVASTIDAGLGRRRGSGQNPSQLTEIAGTLDSGDHRGAGHSPGSIVPDIAHPVATSFHSDPANSRDTLIPEISPALKARDYKGPSSDGDGDGAPLIVGALQAQFPTQTQAAVSGHMIAAADPIAFAYNQSPSRTIPSSSDVTSTLQASPTSNPAVAYPAQLNSVRRLMPVECARLQGFPDDYLDKIKGGSDSAKYRAFGNSMAVPVIAWLGSRIAAVEAIPETDL